ncbi:MAG: PTS sugar transporter subunit IIA [Candidatus Cloacimonetes bacterium]|nr:PTS sugar transporter subunit IIA [Candidatus Cloacimonadota bacterium]
MELTRVLSEKTIAVNRQFSSKEEVLQAISVLAKNSPILSEFSSEDIFWALSEREDLSSTGFGKGIAIPHCILDCSEFVIGAITIPEGVDFDSIDNKPVRILVFIIAPENMRNMHIRYLSAFSGMLNHELNQTKLLAVKDEAGLRGIFLRHTELPESESSAAGWNQFTFVIQSEEIMDRVLSLLTEVDDTNIAVTDAYSAGHFLYNKPLFSSLWGTPMDNYCKIVVATVPRKLANEILRRVHQLVNKEFPEGLLVTMQELQYYAGTLNLG